MERKRCPPGIPHAAVLFKREDKRGTVSDTHRS